MPRKPKRPCSYPGCPALTNNLYCGAHAVMQARNYEKYDRDPETWKRYGSTWRKVRRRYLSEHPLCEECLRKGWLTPAHEVHHKVPLRSGGTHNPENLAALCKKCHSAITIQEHRSYAHLHD